MLLQQQLHHCVQLQAGKHPQSHFVLSITRTATPRCAQAHAQHVLLSQPKLASPTRRLCVARSVATESLTGPPLVLGSYDEAVFEPSNDLRELAAAQLQSLFQILRRISPGSHSSCKACVYARRADSLDAPQMKLQRVACCKSAHLQPPGTFGYSGGSSSSSSSSSGSNNSFEELDEILTLHRAAWEPGSSSSSGSSSCETEALLINEEIVLLPSSNLLVLPLAEAGVLVGLLVVEVLNKPGSPVPHQPQPLQQQQQDQQQQQQGQPAWELPPVLGLSEDVLWALRMSVPPLAKACAMDLRTALAGAQQEARQRLARSLLLEVRGPLKVLGTFGTMLAPRLRTGQSGEPESDMADGMILQGQRLADVVAQLEAALRPAPRVTQQPSLSSSSSSSGEWVTPDEQQQEQQQQQPWREPLALPAAAMDDGNVSEDDDSWAFADGSAPVQQQQRVRAAAANGGGTAGPRPKLLGAGVQQQQQQIVVADLVPGQHTAESLGSSSRDIRWSAVEPTKPKVVVPAALQSSSSSSSSSSSALCVPSTVRFDAAKTIDLEAQVITDAPSAGTAAAAAAAAAAVAPAAAAESATLWSSSSSSSSSSSVSTPVQVAESGLMQLRATAAAADRDGQQQRQQQQVKRPVQRAVCNVVDVLSHLLSAAAGLAQLQGVHLIINDPLSLDPPHSTKSSSSSSSTALVLLPCPVRPLLAGVAGNVCRRVLGYCVDVALQCTPRGGQLCVTARASSGGVEVSLMHTGQAQPSRLHTSTASMDAAALGTSVDAPALAASAAAGGPAGSLVRRRKRKLEASAAAAAADSSSSSSSRWSTGLQELSSSSGLRGGSSLITLDFARQILQSIGGRLSLTYPYHFINAMTGQLEVGSNIEVWLPPPAPAPTAG